MDFTMPSVAQVTSHLLQREQRLSYRALKTCSSRWMTRMLGSALKEELDLRQTALGRG